MVGKEFTSIVLGGNIKLTKFVRFSLIVSNEFF